MPLILQRITALLCLVLIAAALYFHFGEPLWNDEIYTLQTFVLKGFGVTLTDYHVPNNHILANLLYGLWLQVSAVSDLGVLLDHPWRIRLMPAVFSGLTLWYVFQAGKQLGDRSTGWLALVLLLSGITFQAYAFQVRGYALTMAASAALAAGCLQWAAGKPFSRLQQVGLGLSAAVLLYTLPSNLYAWAAAFGGLVLAQIWTARTEGMKPLWPMILTLSAGALLAFLCYQPVLQQLLGSEYFASGVSKRGEHFQQFQRVMLDFFSSRWLLAPLFLAGAYFGWQKGAGPRKQWIWLLTVLLLPFLFSTIRGDMPPDRAYLVLLPVFALALTAGIHSCVERVPASWTRPVYGLLLLYCTLSYAYGVYQVRQQLRAGLDTKDHYYPGLNKNYYQHFYDPNAEYDLFRQKYGTDKVLILESTEEHDLPVYLQHKNQAFMPLDSIESFLRRHQTVYVSSNYAKSFLQEMGKMGPGWKCRYLQNEGRIPRVVVCEAVGQ